MGHMDRLEYAGYVEGHLGIATYLEKCENDKTDGRDLGYQKEHDMRDNSFRLIATHC